MSELTGEAKRLYWTMKNAKDKMTGIAFQWDEIPPAVKDAMKLVIVSMDECCEAIEDASE